MMVSCTSQALPNLRRLALRCDNDVLQLPLGVRLPSNCSVDVAGTLKRVSSPARAFADGGVDGGIDGSGGRCSAISACAAVLADTVLERDAQSLSFELGRDLPLMCESRDLSGIPIRRETSAELLVAALKRYIHGVSDHQIVQMSCSIEGAILRILIVGTSEVMSNA